MSKEDFLEKYGNVSVKFSSYYNYTFTYSGPLPGGREIAIRVGGHEADISRLYVVSWQEHSVAELEPYAGLVFDVEKELDSFDDRRRPLADCVFI